MPTTRSSYKRKTKTLKPKKVNESEGRRELVKLRRNKDAIK